MIDTFLCDSGWY